MNRITILTLVTAIIGAWLLAAYWDQKGDETRSPAVHLMPRHSKRVSNPYMPIPCFVHGGAAASGDCLKD